MFGQKTYAVYVKPDDDNPLETALFVKEGFSFPAYVFSFFWALYNQIWWLAGVCFVVAVGKEFLVVHEVINEQADWILTVAYLAFIGLQAQDWYGEELQRKGYVIIGIVMGGNLEDAQQRFLDKYIRRARRVGDIQSTIGALPAG